MRVNGFQKRQALPRFALFFKIKPGGLMVPDRRRGLSIKEVRGLAAAAACILLLVFAAEALRYHANMERKDRWVKTTGKMLQSYVMHTCTSPNPNSKRISSAEWDRICTRYDSPHVTYGYEVDGKRYVNGDIWVHWPGPLVAGGWTDWIKSHPVGSKADVYYDKEDARVSVLDTRWDEAGDQSGLILTGVLALVFVTVWLRLNRQINPPKKDDGPDVTPKDDNPGITWS
jgi:hypothetical protein